jgi:UPF0755 protein
MPDEGSVPFDAPASGHNVLRPGPSGARGGSRGEGAIGGGVVRGGVVRGGVVRGGAGPREGSTNGPASSATAGGGVGGGVVRGGAGPREGSTNGPASSATAGGGVGGGGVRGGPGIAGAIRRHPARSLLGALVVLAVGFLAWSVAWYEGQSGGSPGGVGTIVKVSEGNSMGDVTARLASQHVLDSTIAFRIYLVLHGTPVVQPGDYLLHRHEPFSAVRSVLAAGPDVFALSIPPGFTVRETASRLAQLPGHSASAFSSLVTTGAVRSPWQPPGSTNLDGLLGAGTYIVLPGETDKTLLEQMIERFDTEADEVGLTQGAASLGITPYQAVIVASIVQKEGVYPQNLSKVARVIYNRLAAGMDLQMNSTVLYAEGRDGGPVTSADLALNTPYNTYLYPGLTPTPICFPSEASLRAALDPAVGNWLYFVLVSQDGTEAFSDTLAGQDANEQLAKSRGLP